MADLTKQALISELKFKMQKKPFNKITVKELVDSCGVNRQTFYYHFQDIYDLLSYIYRKEAVGAIEEYKSYSTWQKGLSIILDYVETNKIFCLNTLHSVGREHLEQFLQTTVFQLLQDVVDELAEHKAVCMEHKQFIAVFYGHAFIGIVIDWIVEGMKTNSDQLVDKLSRLVEGEFSKAIQKFIS